MFSFFGWEAGSHLVGDLRDPRRQLPRALAGALAVIVVLHLGLAVATIGKATSATFAAVYIVAMAAGVRLLDGAARLAAGIALVAMLAVFAFFGLYLLVPALIALAVNVPRRARTRALQPA